MKLSHAFALSIVLGISTTSTFLHADEPTTQPMKPEKKAKAMHVTGVYSKLDNLTDDEKSKIVAIHKTTLDEKRKLDAKEEDDIKLLLTDEQRSQLRTLKEDTTAKRKTKEAEKKTDEAATTQPANGM